MKSFSILGLSTVSDLIFIIISSIVSLLFCFSSSLLFVLCVFITFVVVSYLRVCMPFDSSSVLVYFIVVFFNDTATTEIYTE